MGAKWGPIFHVGSESHSENAGLGMISSAKSEQRPSTMSNAAGTTSAPTTRTKMPELPGRFDGIVPGVFL